MFDTRVVSKFGLSYFFTWAISIILTHLFILLFSVLVTIIGKLEAFQCLVVSHETNELWFHNCGQRPNTREFTDRPHPADTPSSIASVHTNLDETTSILSPRLAAPWRTHSLLYAHPHMITVPKLHKSR